MPVNAARPRTLIKRHPLIAFFVIAFVITWGPVPAGIFMAAGPLLAALFVTAMVEGRHGLRALWQRLSLWRVGLQWYAAALLVPLAVVLGSGGLTVALGAPGSVFGRLQVSSLVLLFGIRLVIPVMAPIGEEPGWRGFALPRLLSERSAFEATLLLGVVVALWHIPLIFLASENLPPIFLLATVAVTFFYSWLFIRSGGSVFITIVAHAAEGVVGNKFTGANGFAGADKTHWILLYTAGWCIVALGVLALDRRVWWSRTRPSAPLRGGAWRSSAGEVGNVAMAPAWARLR